MTTISPVVLPSIADYSWRAIDPADAASLAALTDAADHADNNDILSVPMQQPRDLASADLSTIPTMAAVTTDGTIAGVAWLTFDEDENKITANLRGRVHPDHRRKGIGSALLRWSEAAARAMLADQPKAVHLFIRNETLTDDARRMYAKLGFDLKFIEYVMRRSLSDPLPDFPMPPGVITRTWETNLIPAFYDLYSVAFAERPGFPGWTYDEWLDWIAGGDDFKPEYSWLAYENEQPIGFLISDVDPVGMPVRAGWITQIGAHPIARRRGIGAALLVKAMGDFRAIGLDYLALMVNDNNPTAQALYLKVGLDVYRYRGKYEKRG